MNFYSKIDTTTKKKILIMGCGKQSQPHNKMMCECDMNKFKFLFENTSTVLISLR